MTATGEKWDLFRAANAGKVDMVKNLLAAGAKVNARAARPHAWTSAAEEPTALNCALTAFQYDAHLLEVVKLLLAAGATVDDTHFADFAAESLGDDLSARIQALLEAHKRP